MIPRAFWSWNPPKIRMSRRSTAAWRACRAIVGGFIQAVEPFEDHNVLLLCNEEAKLLGLPENRFLRNRNGIPYDIIHGTFFLAQGSGESFCSLTDEQIQTYTRLYSRERLFTSLQHGRIPFSECTAEADIRKVFRFL